MKIAFVHQPIGGVIQPEKHADSLTILVYELARRLARSCEVIVYDRRIPGQLEIENFEGVQYRRLSPQFDRNLLFRCLKPFSRLRGPRRPLFASNWFHRSYIKRIARDLRQQHCDFAFVLSLPQYPSIIRELNPAVRTVLNIQCEWLNQLDRRMVSRQLQSVDLVLGCSEYIAQKARAALPEHAEKCKALLNGCDVYRFRPASISSSGPKRLLFLARVSPEKGAHVLIEAFRQIAERHPETELDIVGPEWVIDRSMNIVISGDDRVRELARYDGKSYVAALKEMVPSSLAARVRFCGLVPHEQIAKYYGNAYALVFPSVWDEPFGLPLIEAMAAGLPVIATSTGGIPEVVANGKTGLLVPPNDPKALAEAISRLLDDPDLHRRMSQTGRERAVSKFSWDRMADELLSDLNELAKRPASGIMEEVAASE